MNTMISNLVDFFGIIAICLNKELLSGTWVHLTNCKIECLECFNGFNISVMVCMLLQLTEESPF